MRIHLIFEREDLSAASRKKDIEYLHHTDFRYPFHEMFFRAEHVKFVDLDGAEVVLKDRR